MSEVAPEPALTPAETPALPAPALSAEDAQKEIDKWKALSRKNEDNAKANKSAADELAQLKEAQMTEAQKLQKAADKAASESASARAELARFKVSNATGVPVELLTGTDEASLTAQAEAIKAFAGSAQTSTPSPDLGQGDRGASAPASANDWLRKMSGR